MQTTTKKLLTIALTAVAVTTASLAVTGEASAHGKGGKRFFFVSKPYFYSAAPVYPLCWKWIGGKKVWVCGY